jgi:RNA polymerase sigma-70 factor (ECF subfamily)
VSARDPRADHALIRRVADGDRRAFATLVEQYRGPLYRFILRQVRRPAVAEELLQETFLRLHQGASRYEPRAALSTWLFRIATNLCLNEAATAHARHETLGETPERAHPQANPAEALERKEVGAAVEAALATLPPQQRAAVQLARFEGMTYADIAEVLGVSVAAVDSLLQRARQKLRLELQHLA